MASLQETEHILRGNQIWQAQVDRLQGTIDALTSEIAEKDRQLEETFARAKRVVQPIIDREERNEVVTEDVMGFRVDQEGK
jgi:peptidoglycan hydrolase CwlO-like protein